MDAHLIIRSASSNATAEASVCVCSGPMRCTMCVFTRCVVQKRCAQTDIAADDDEDDGVLAKTNTEFQRNAAATTMMTNSPQMMCVRHYFGYRACYFTVGQRWRERTAHSCCARALTLEPDRTVHICLPSFQLSLYLSFSLSFSQ